MHFSEAREATGGDSDGETPRDREGEKARHCRLKDEVGQAAGVDETASWQQAADD